MTTCTAPLTSTTLCGAPATDSRLIEGVACPLCLEHALVVDAEAEIAIAIATSTAEDRTVILRADDEAHASRLTDALACESDDSAVHGGAVEAWGGDDADGTAWTVRVEVASTPRTEEAWWAWHDADAERASASVDEAQAAARAWASGESDDGPGTW